MDERTPSAGIGDGNILTITGGGSASSGSPSSGVAEGAPKNQLCPHSAKLAAALFDCLCDKCISQCPDSCANQSVPADLCKVCSFMICLDPSAACFGDML